MKCAIVEYTWSHGEILPTLIHVMNGLGIGVDLFMSRQIRSNDPFVFTPGLTFRAGSSSGLRFRAQVESRGFTDYDFVVFNSIEPTPVLRKALRAKRPVLAVMHNGALLRHDPDYAAFFLEARRKPLFLSKAVSDFLSSGDRPLPWFAPVLVADVPSSLRGSRGPVRFCVQGNLAYDRRNYASLLDAVSELAAAGATGFVVSLVGRRRPDGGRFCVEAVRRGINHYFEFAERGIDRFLEFAGRGIHYRDYYLRLADSHFILPLVDRSTPAYADYYHDKITSSLSIAIGMGLVPVIDEELAMLYGVENCSITYRSGGLAHAMRHAMILRSDDYQTMKNGLVDIRKALCACSRNNIERAIHEIMDQRIS